MSNVFDSVLSPGLQSGVDVINRIDTQKFLLVLNRVSQGIQKKSDDMKPFSDEEEEKLAVTLSISQSDLKLLLNCSALILKQAAFNITKPNALEQVLSKHYKLSEDKVEAFVVTWASHAKDIVVALKRKSMYPQQVEGISWLLNTSVITSEPRAVIELKLHHTDDNTSHLHLDLDQASLTELYDTLETIQSRLDGLR